VPQTKSQVASTTAKSGYFEEDLVAQDLNNREDLRVAFMKFIGNHVLGVFHKVTGNFKTDVSDGHINIQVKKHKKGQFGQVDRHWVDNLLDKVPKLKTIQKYLKGCCELPEAGSSGMCDRMKKVIKLTTNNYSPDELESSPEIHFSPQ
jgi:hypothetical protein